jgi:hypothetical protein
MTETEAYAYFGATLKNLRWAYSAIAKKPKSLILSCWERYMTQDASGNVRYEVKNFQRWKASNPRGKLLLEEHLKQAYKDRLPVHMVVAVTEDPGTGIVVGVTGTDLDPTFSVRDDLVGKVVEFDTGRFVIDFTKLQQ